MFYNYVQTSPLISGPQYWLKAKPKFLHVFQGKLWKFEIDQQQLLFSSNTFWHKN